MTPSYMNHLMSCKSCYAASANYCATGLVLKIDSFAEFVLEQKTKESRQHWMSWIRKTDPQRYELYAEAVNSKIAIKKLAAESILN